MPSQTVGLCGPFATAGKRPSRLTVGRFRVLCAQPGSAVSVGRVRRGEICHSGASTNGPAMHNDRDPSEKFSTPIREPKPGMFHRPVHGFGAKRAPAAAELRLSGPMTGEQKLGEGLRELPLVGKADVARTTGET